MAHDLIINYPDLEEAIRKFRSAQQTFLRFNESASPQAVSQDPVAEQHRNVISDQEAKILTSAATLFTRAVEGTVQAQEVFREADQMGLH